MSKRKNYEIMIRKSTSIERESNESAEKFDSAMLVEIEEQNFALKTSSCEENFLGKRSQISPSDDDTDITDVLTKKLSGQSMDNNRQSTPLTDHFSKNTNPARLRDEIASIIDYAGYRVQMPEGWLETTSKSRLLELYGSIDSENMFQWANRIAGHCPIPRCLSYFDHFSAARHSAVMKLKLDGVDIISPDLLDAAVPLRNVIQRYSNSLWKLFNVLSIKRPAGVPAKMNNSQHWADYITSKPLNDYCKISKTVLNEKAAFKKELDFFCVATNMALAEVSKSDVDLLKKAEQIKSCCVLLYAISPIHMGLSETDFVKAGVKDLYSGYCSYLRRSGKLTRQADHLASSRLTINNKPIPEYRLKDVSAILEECREVLQEKPIIQPEKVKKSLIIAEDGKIMFGDGMLPDMRPSMLEVGTMGHMMCGISEYSDDMSLFREPSENNWPFNI